VSAKLAKLINIYVKFKFFTSFNTLFVEKISHSLCVMLVDDNGIEHLANAIFWKLKSHFLAVKSDKKARKKF